MRLSDFHFMTEGPSKECRANKPPRSRRVWESSDGDTTCPTTLLDRSCWYPLWLINVCTPRKDPELERLPRESPEANPITIKPKTVSHVAKQSSWVPLLGCFPRRAPL
ncbi:unnamed protein product [Rangifer tarandus platyrhynchus]|uniref:Uncharacterized protein n=2 Tax=Rangifer tarandus platyrhynchus TaxID=3082113 RepID=A0ABN9A437_RANTA|nr:unnamed protein product [Rangifer tarandus platyrhynchus]